MHNINKLLDAVLVSGGGGDIGVAIGRILQELNISNVIGCDVKREHAGECVFDFFSEAPLANDDNYFEFLKNAFEQYKVGLFIPTSEAEIKAIFDFGLVNGELFGVPVLITTEKTARIALDKLETANALKVMGVNAPWTELATSQPRALPCIFKPRSGQGSKGLKVVHTLSEAQSLSGSEGYIWQELLLPDDQEFTCGVYRHATGECRSILMRRTLSGGFTDKGEVVKDSIIEHYILTIAEELDVQGAINFQLRLTNKGPVLFEINPRLSSTVMFRHKLGFTDLVWAIEGILDLPLSQYQEPKAGTKFYRGIQEYIK
ncbi:ATP-grasp domain-containing protein [Aliivibrio sp. 1S128]|uniref:ATP-grasp domain-containing protein n=1 Tax=Aliivibrio sp. 1S128 TaxID=1840085 RepID=UPI00080DC04C|nr:ATP-grasp domain-containing protein [Aliivibrio sp. 1S128]OCH25516.1 hypothetical protein A6E03_01580 [Aliivibrio sp. 1S128]